MVVDLVCEIVCVCVCERGKEGRFEAPAKRMCLGSVSFCRVKDYGRVAANEQEFSDTQLCCWLFRNRRCWIHGSCQSFSHSLPVEKWLHQSRGVLLQAHRRCCYVMFWILVRSSDIFKVALLGDSLSTLAEINNVRVCHTQQAIRENHSIKIHVCWCIELVSSHLIFLHTSRVFISSTASITVSKVC